MFIRLESIFFSSFQGFSAEFLTEPLLLGKSRSRFAVIAAKKISPALMIITPTLYLTRFSSRPEIDRTYQSPSARIKLAESLEFPVPHAQQGSM
jgi:hypothetical protein